LQTRIRRAGLARLHARACSSSCGRRASSARGFRPTDAEPFSFLAVRFAIVAVSWRAALVAGAPWPSRRAAGHALVVGALIHGGYLGLVFWSISNGLPAGVSALIVGCSRC
jgi:drug/metabolite transporter (DMT)-like permease